MLEDHLSDKANRCSILNANHDLEISKLMAIVIGRELFLIEGPSQLHGSYLSCIIDYTYIHFIQVIHLTISAG